nr:TPA_asm: m120.2 ORF [Murid betaherpesvirus 1]DBA08090.1 TPA_asm: m120.2 ORF [Murid betaherpesvirus 1]
MAHQPQEQREMTVSPFPEPRREPSARPKNKKKSKKNKNSPFHRSGARASPQTLGREESPASLIRHNTAVQHTMTFSNPLRAGPVRYQYPPTLIYRQRSYVEAPGARYHPRLPLIPHFRYPSVGMMAHQPPFSGVHPTIFTLSPFPTTTTPQILRFLGPQILVRDMFYIPRMAPGAAPYHPWCEQMVAPRPQGHHLSLYHQILQERAEYITNPQYQLEQRMQGLRLEDPRAQQVCAVRREPVNRQTLKQLPPPPSPSSQQTDAPLSEEGDDARSARQDTACGGFSRQQQQQHQIPPGPRQLRRKKYGHNQFQKRTGPHQPLPACRKDNLPPYGSSQPAVLTVQQRGPMEQVPQPHPEQ